jgi:hypothetical protein
LNGDLGDWSREQLVEWVELGLRTQRLVCIWSAGEIVGVGCARLLNEGDDTRSWTTVHDESASLVFIDLVVVTEPVMPVLWQAMKKRFGNKDEVLFRRLRDGRLRRFDLKRFEQHLTRHGN